MNDKEYERDPPVCEYRGSGSTTVHRSWNTGVSGSDNGPPVIEYRDKWVIGSPPGRCTYTTGWIQENAFEPCTLSTWIVKKETQCTGTRQE